LALAQDGAPLATAPNWYASVGAGTFDPEPTPGQLENKDGDYSFMMNLGYRYSRYLRLEFDLWAYEQDVDTPPTVAPPLLGTVDPRADIAGGGLSAVAKLGLPIEPFEPYVGAGAGVFFSTMRVTGTVIGLPAQREEDDTGIGSQLLAGVDLALSRQWSAGIEYRRVFLKASFADLTPGEVDIGGIGWMLTARWQFAPRP
jgi:hypothetical protein